LPTGATMTITCVISKTPWISMKPSCINVDCVVDMNDDKIIFLLMIIMINMDTKRSNDIMSTLRLLPKDVSRIPKPCMGY